jgi:hypothetical protein
VDAGVGEHPARVTRVATASAITAARRAIEVPAMG